MKKYGDRRNGGGGGARGGRGDVWCDYVGNQEGTREVMKKE